jgi:hypothetical protein
MDFSADAIIRTRIFSDDFNRVVAQGLGGEWVWVPYDSWPATSPETAIMFVDGEAAVIQAPDGESYYESYAGFPVPETGDLYFDFWVPPDWEVGLPTITWVLWGASFSVAADAESWDVGVSSEAGGTSELFGPNPDTWYRFHARWTSDTVFINVWARANDEPEAWLLEAGFAFIPDYSPSYLDFYQSPRGPVPGKIDNFEIWQSQDVLIPRGGFSADAEIYQPSFTADAEIYQPSFTADAEIYQPSLTADAVIQRTIDIPFSSLGSVDTFTDNDGTDLGIHTPDFGPKWQAVDAVVVFDGKWWPIQDPGVAQSWLYTGQHDYDIEFDYFGYDGSVTLSLRDDNAGNAVVARVGHDDVGGAWAVVAEKIDGAWSYTYNKEAGFFSPGTIYLIRVTLIADQASIYVDGILADSLSLTYAFGSTDLCLTANYGNVIDNWNFPFALPGTQFSASAVVFDGHYYFGFTASAFINPPPIPLIASISIKVNGIDITDDVVLEDTEFTSQASGANPGTCSFRVKDKSRSMVFVVGQTLTLDIDDKRMWGGWVQNVSRQFFFPYAGAEWTQPRAWKIEGVDYNILFRKRFCSDKADRSNMELKSWPADTDDSIQIHYLCEHHLDLEGDGIDYTTMIEAVGSPNPDKTGNAYGASWSWEAAMSNISNYPGAIYYIDANKRLVYADVDTVSAWYPLSDTPGAGEIGYREMEIIYNGSNLVNDALVWGAGQGSKLVKFKRVRDQVSIDAHGLWQHGDFRSDMWRQASVDKRASGFVYGSPQNKRGAKDDAVSVMVTVFEPVYLAGEKVDFRSNVFGFEDVIPIRQMKITFPTKEHAQFDLMLSHYIDQPWNTSEFWFPPIRIPPPVVEIPPPTEPYCPVVTYPNTFVNPDGSVSQLVAASVPIFTDDFNRVSETQPVGQHGYWGDHNGTNFPPVLYTMTPDFTDQALWIAGQYIWFDAPLSTGVQIIAKMFLPDEVFPDFSFGWGLFGVDAGKAWVSYDSTPADFSLTGHIFVRYVDYEGYYSALKIWAQDSPEPANWTVTGSPSQWALPSLHLTADSAYLEAVTVFSQIHPSPVDISSWVDPAYGGDPYGPLSWHHEFPFTEPFELHWVAGDVDDFWAVTWGSESSSRTGDAPHHQVKMVWSYVHGYGPYTYQAQHQTQAVAIPAGRATSAITVSGTVLVSATYNHWWDENRTPQSAPVTVNFDVYNYDEGEPYWVSPPHAALGRTALSLSAACVAGNRGQQVDVELPFSFVVPADMLPNIDAVGGFQWGVKVWNPEGVLSSLSPEGQPSIYPNSTETSVRVTSVVTYKAAYVQGPATGYFCTPPTQRGGTNDQRVCESFALASIIPELETMPPGSYDVPRLVRVITVATPYLGGSVEVTADGILARPGVDFVETDPALGTVTLLNAFTSIQTVLICYFSVVRDWSYWHYVVM